MEVSPEFGAAASVLTMILIGFRHQRVVSEGREGWGFFWFVALVFFAYILYLNLTNL